MAPYLAHDLIYDLIAFQLVLILIALANTRTLRRTGRHPAPARFPSVSILVPARNEEANVERCVASLLAQDYVGFKVLVLDDESTDQTRAILDALAAGSPRLTVLDGRPLPAGWLGKNWACAQLAARAGGELLFFTDADTFHRPDTLRALVTALEGERAGLLSGFPRQEVLTWGEKLIVPFFSWLLYCFLPLGVAYRLRFPALSCAVGQMLLFRRTVYQAIGGHQAVRGVIAEDLALARRTKALGYRWRMIQATHLISCRMYRGGREAYAGLTKNLLAAFEFRLLPYLFAWLWLLLMFLKPWSDLAIYALGWPLDVPLAAVLLCILLALIVWLVPYRRLALPLSPAALYLATLLTIESIAFRSLWLSLTGTLTWKNRTLITPQPKLW